MDAKRGDLIVTNGSLLVEGQTIEILRPWFHWSIRWMRPHIRVAVADWAWRWLGLKLHWMESRGQCRITAVDRNTNIISVEAQQ